jgi:hypothetical protein
MGVLTEVLRAVDVSSGHHNISHCKDEYSIDECQRGTLENLIPSDHHDGSGGPLLGPRA